MFLYIRSWLSGWSEPYDTPYKWLFRKYVEKYVVSVLQKYVSLTMQDELRSLALWVWIQADGRYTIEIYADDDDELCLGVATWPAAGKDAERGIKEMPDDCEWIIRTNISYYDRARCRRFLRRLGKLLTTPESIAALRGDSIDAWRQQARSIASALKSEFGMHRSSGRSLR